MVCAALAAPAGSVARVVAPGWIVCSSGADHVRQTFYCFDGRPGIHTFHLEQPQFGNTRLADKRGNGPDHRNRRLRSWYLVSLDAPNNRLFFGASISVGI